jgi:hypothetical protein
MGILDDAIREHLELKRAHGASDAEVTAQEAEAFGPVRPEAAMPAPPLEGAPTQMLSPEEAAALQVDAPAAADPVGEETVVHPPPDLEPEPLVPSAEDPAVVDPGDHPVPDPHDHAHGEGSDPAWGEDTDFFAEQPAAPAAAEPEPAPPAQHHDEQHPALHDHDAIHAEEHPPEPVFRSEAPGGPEAPTGPGPVVDPPVQEPPIQEPPAEADEEDVLEETPEFLQDAPEHDRLWFEQRPPRDFDFGE